MSPTYISAVVIIIAQALSLFGIEIGPEDVTVTVNTVVTIVAGLLVLWRRLTKGDITVSGARRR